MVFLLPYNICAMVDDEVLMMVGDEWNVPAGIMPSGTSGSDEPYDIVFFSKEMRDLRRFIWRRNFSKNVAACCACCPDGVTVSRFLLDTCVRLAFAYWRLIRPSEIGLRGGNHFRLVITAVKVDVWQGPSDLPCPLWPSYVSIDVGRHSPCVLLSA